MAPGWLISASVEAGFGVALWGVRRPEGGDG